MARLQVEISMIDDAGTSRLHALIEEPTRIDVDRDPLYVFGRIAALVERATEQVHDQALQLDQEADRGRGAPA